MRIKNTDITVVKQDIDKVTADYTAKAFDNNKAVDEQSVRQACCKALQYAGEGLKARSIAFSALSRGKEGLPLGACAKIMAQEVLKFLRKPTSLQEIIFCLDDEEEYQVFKKSTEGYLEYMLYKMQEGPYITVDAIIELKEGIILIERSNPPYGWALPGGFVDYGESLEDAVAREAKEETNMNLVDLRQFHVYSKPDRDPRFHTIATVFVAKGEGTPQFGDDAKGLKIVKYEDLLNLEYVFDHKEIINDYLASRS